MNVIEDDVGSEVHSQLPTEFRSIYGPSSARQWAAVA